MADLKLIFFPLGETTELIRAELREAGYLAIEVRDPKEIVIPVEGAPLASADDLFMSALTAITGNYANSGVAGDFAATLLKRLKARRETPQA